MRFLLPLLLLAPLTIAQTTQPAVDIPRLDNITIDGDAADWGDRGMRYDVLSESVPARKPYANHDALARLGWSDAGLLVYVEVIDDSPVEAETDNALWGRDSLELFFAPGDGGPRVYAQFIASPGLDPEHPKLRKQFLDQRDPAHRGKPAGETIAAKKTATGYAIEALLPWTLFDLRPASGLEVRLQAYVNDFDTGPGMSQLLLYPQKGQYGVDMTRSIRLRLAEKPSEPVTTAASATIERLRRVRVNVAAPADADHATVHVLPEPVMDVGQARLQKQGRLAVASLTIPVKSSDTPKRLAVDIDAKPVRTIELPDLEKQRERLRAELPVVTQFVFERASFPGIDFESPAEAEDLIGLYTVSTKFYDANFVEVTKPKNPGRYGAIVTITPNAGGEPLTRFLTLYRTPEPVKWRGGEAAMKLTLPPEFGIEQNVLDQYAGDVGAFTLINFRSYARQHDGIATMLAEMAESKPGAEPGVARLGAWPRNTAYWYELKKRAGYLRPYQYLDHLPKGYADDPQKKWPLLLFLHGSGERGTDVKMAGSHGPLKEIRNGREIPMVVVAPQCPYGTWWNPLQLRDLLDELSAKYRIDPDRIYLTGLSMGGYGSWELATLFPDRFAAVAPVCGGGDPRGAERLKDLPIWVFHGGRDEVVYPEESYKMVAALRERAGRVRFTFYPEATHNSWTQAYGTAELYDWFLKQKRGQPDQPPATQAGTRPSE